jgi:hypothetical protein
MSLSPGIFLYWNSNPTAAGLKGRLAAIKKAGFECVYIHPMSDKFQKHFFFRGMDIPYLGKKYFELMHVVVSECKKLGLTLMLYDESGWPSGSVLDTLLQKHPEACRKYIDSNGNTGDQFVPDLIGGKATDFFIEMVHEKYRRELGDEFGKTIKGLFTDEPFWKITFSDEKMSIPPKAIPYPDGMEEELREIYGVEFQEILPKLFSGKTSSLEDISAERDIYVDCLARLFRKNYTEKISAWCRKNNLLFEGHYDEDHEYFYFRGPNMLQLLSPMDIPGGDAIWRQIYPGGGNDGHYARFAQAAAIRQKRSMTFFEVFCVYGYYLTTRDMAWVGNMLLSKGINRLLMMPSIYSDVGLRKICCGTDISPRAPFWNVLPALNSFWNWAGKYNTGALDKPVWVLVRRDVNDPDFGSKCDRLFDMLDDSLVEWRLADEDDLCKLPAGSDQLLVVPGKLTAEEKQRLTLSGAKVINGFDTTALQKLPRLNAIPCSGIRILRCMRQEGEVLMIFNKSSEDKIFRLHETEGFRSELPPPDNILCETFPVFADDDYLNIPVPAGTLRIVTKTPAGSGTVPPEHSIRLQLQWLVKKVKHLRMSKYGRTHYETIKVNKPLPANGITELYPEFSGIAELECTFTSPTAGTVWIQFDDIQHGAELFCNGKSCGLRAFAPWIFKMDVRKGTNKLRMVLSGSAGNEYARCAREELEPAGWYNDYARIRKKFKRSDRQTLVTSYCTLMY